MRQFRQLAEQSLLTPAPAAVVISLPPTPPKGMGVRTKVVISPPPTPPKGMGVRTKVIISLPPTPPKGMGAKTMVVISLPPTPPKGMGAKTKVVAVMTTAATTAACLIRTKKRGDFILSNC